MKTRILLIEDDESFVNSIRLALRDYEVEVVWAPTGACGLEMYRKSLHTFAAVIIDYCLPDLLGSDVARQVRKLNPSQDVLFASGHQNPEYLIDLLETGQARTFLNKGKPVPELRERIQDSLSRYENQNRVLGLDCYSPSRVELDLRNAGFIGRSPRMLEAIQDLRKFQALEYPVLIVGETGTGKEMFANALVPKGKRLIVVNCPQFTQSENLLESELFGYVKGAFTGANADKPGLLAQVHGHVVLFDELHELSHASQTKLLRLLQQMTYRRVGDHTGREISVQFRVIATVKPDIYERVRDGRFHEDLLHRVSPLEIHVPALRERLEDIEPLVRAVQDDFNCGKPEGTQKQFRISTIRELTRLPWTGNVRQLQNIAKRLLAVTEGDIINPVDLDKALGQNGSARALHSTPASSLEAATRQFETGQITNVLKQCRTQAEAANRLGIEPSTLQRKMVRLGIRAGSYLAKTS